MDRHFKCKSCPLSEIGYCRKEVCLDSRCSCKLCDNIRDLKIAMILMMRIVKMSIVLAMIRVAIKMQLSVSNYYITSHKIVTHHVIRLNS